MRPPNTIEHGPPEGTRISDALNSSAGASVRHRWERPSLQNRFTTINSTAERQPLVPIVPDFRGGLQLAKARTRMGNLE
jgi:transcriptional regulator NrdR family protein